jgi:hypothetical protein
MPRWCAAGVRLRGKHFGTGAALLAGRVNLDREFRDLTTSRLVHSSFLPLRIGPSFRHCSLVSQEPA